MGGSSSSLEMRMGEILLEGGEFLPGGELEISLKMWGASLTFLKLEREVGESWNGLEEGLELVRGLGGVVVGEDIVLALHRFGERGMKCWVILTSTSGQPSTVFLTNEIRNICEISRISFFRPVSRHYALSIQTKMEAKAKASLSRKKKKAKACCWNPSGTKTKRELSFRILSESENEVPRQRQHCEQCWRVHGSKMEGERAE